MSVVFILMRSGVWLITPAAAKKDFSLARAQASGSATAAAAGGLGKARATLSRMLHPQFLQFQYYSLTVENVGDPQIVFK